MTEEHFLEYLQKQFRELEVSITKILKEEKKTRDEILIKKGFIIHNYSLNYKKINHEVLTEIIEQLKIIIKKETQLQEDLKQHSISFNALKEIYEPIPGNKKLHIDLLPKYLKEEFYYSGLLITRLKQLKLILQDDIKLHKKSLPYETDIFFASIENIMNKMIKFVKILEQLARRVILFEKDAYYPKLRTYGRAMSSHEFKNTLAKKRLSSSKNFIHHRDLRVNSF